MSASWYEPAPPQRVEWTQLSEEELSAAKLLGWDEDLWANELEAAGGAGVIVTTTLGCSLGITAACGAARHEGLDAGEELERLCGEVLVPSVRDEA